MQKVLRKENVYLNKNEKKDMVSNGFVPVQVESRRFYVQRVDHWTMLSVYISGFQLAL